MRERRSPWFARDQLPPLDVEAALTITSSPVIVHAVLTERSAAFFKFTTVGQFGMYFDRKLRPLSPFRWARLFESEEYKRVGLTRLGPDDFVSTVWLGWGRLSYRPDNAEPCGLFETMVRIGGENDFTRWDTEREARAGHEECVRAARETLARVR